MKASIVLLVFFIVSNTIARVVIGMKIDLRAKIKERKEDTRKVVCSFRLFPNCFFLDDAADGHTNYGNFEEKQKFKVDGIPVTLHKSSKTGFSFFPRLARLLMHHAPCVTWYDSLSFLSLASIAGWRSYCAKLQTILRRDPCLWISLWISGYDHNQVLEFIAERCMFRFGSLSIRLVRSPRWYKTASDDGANMFNDASRRRRWIGSHSGTPHFHGKQEISIQGWPS